MNASSRNSGVAHVFALTFAALLLPIHALAQVVEPATAAVMPVAPSAANPPAATSEVFGSDAPAIAVGGAAGLPLFQWGPLGLRPHATYRGTYRTGVPVAPGERVDTGVHAFSPGLLVDVGDHWTADYTITWTHYTNGQLSSRPNHNAAVTAGYVFTDWTFSAAGNYLSSHPTLLETATQNHEIRYGGNVALQHRLTRKLRLDLAAADSYEKAEHLNAVVNGLPLTSTHEVYSQDGLSWFVTDRTVLSPSVRFGSATRGDGPRMTYVTPQLSVGWTPTDRISLGANVGEERRRFHDGGSPTLSSTIYGGSLQYRPFEHTILRAEVTRGVSSTYLANAVARNRGWTVALDQRLFELATLTLSASDRRTSYLQTSGDLPTTRSDRSRRYHARLGVPLLQRGEIAVFYEHIRNNSDTSAFSFTSSEYGVEVSYRF